MPNSLVFRQTRPLVDGARIFFGKMRYMTRGSTGKKFDSKKYIESTLKLEENPKLPETANDMRKR